MLSMLILDIIVIITVNELMNQVYLKLNLPSVTSTSLDQVVAHKLSTIRNADLIAVVSGGCIIETGTHKELINCPNGHYAKLAKLQTQFSFDDQDQNQELGVLSAARSSTGRPSTARSSPAIFPKSPLPDDTTTSSSLVSHPPPSFPRLLSLNAPEWKQGLIGTISAIAFGSVQPLYALTIGGMISAFFAQSHEEMSHRIRTYSIKE